MTIDKAIAILEVELIPFAGQPGPIARDALKLGIEALKAIKSARGNNYWTPIPSLLGETTE